MNLSSPSVSITPCRFVRHSCGSINQGGDHDEEKRQLIKQIADNLLALLPINRGYHRFQLTIANNSSESYYFGGQSTTLVDVTVYTGFDHLTKRRHISDIVILGPNKQPYGARAEFRLYKDGGVMFTFGWAVTHFYLKGIIDTLQDMLQQGLVIEHSEI